MSQTNSIFNTLFSLKGSTSTIKFTSQDLYSIYLVFKGNGLKLTFFQFYSLLFFFLKNFNNLGLNNLFVFLYLFFSTKTNLVYFTSTANKYIASPTNKSNLYLYGGEISLQKLTVFWNKFKKLKRPTTENTFNEFFLKSWEKKINSYKNLGFFQTFNNFYLIVVSLGNLKQTIIQINKPLIISPKFSSTSIAKYLKVDQCNDFEFQFLRKNKVYNKGRYSRCRQNYRTGVYMCMYLSVCSIFGLYYWFYKFTFNFSYLWWFFIAFVASFFLPKIIKYRLYEPTTLFNKFFDLGRWFGSVIRSIFF